MCLDVIIVRALGLVSGVIAHWESGSAKVACQLAVTSSLGATGFSSVTLASAHWIYSHRSPHSTSALACGSHGLQISFALDCFMLCNLISEVIA